MVAVAFDNDDNDSLRFITVAVKPLQLQAHSFHSFISLKSGNTARRQTHTQNRQTDTWAPAGFFPGVGKFIGLARIFGGALVFSKKFTFLVVALKTQPKTILNEPLRSSKSHPPSKKMGC